MFKGSIRYRHLLTVAAGGLAVALVVAPVQFESGELLPSKSIALADKGGNSGGGGGSSSSSGGDGPSTDDATPAAALPSAPAAITATSAITPAAAGPSAGAAIPATIPTAATTPASPAPTSQA